MALVSGIPEKQPGDRLVYGALSRLPDDWIVYAQPRLVYRTRKRKPDYVVVHRDLGVIVLEVKDWANVTSCSAKRAWIHVRGADREKRCTSPVEQAEQACYVLNKMLAQDPDLANGSGDMDFPYRYAGILPYLDQMSIYWLEKFWGKNLILGPDDLLPAVFESRLRSIPAPFTVHLNNRQIAAIRSMIDPEVRHRREQAGSSGAKPCHPVPGGNGAGCAHPSGAEKSSRSPRPGLEESLEHCLTDQAHERNDVPPDPGDVPDPAARITRLQEDLPRGVRDLIPDTRVQLVRGPSGSGKTDFLILRAHFLKEQEPGLSILVTAADDSLLRQRLKPELTALHPDIRVERLEAICEQLFLDYTGRTLKPADPEETLLSMADSRGICAPGEVPFLAEEISWMKENGCVTRKKYLDSPRDGRGSRWKRLTATERQRVFRIFRAYQKTLENSFAYDRADIHARLRSFLEKGGKPAETYDVILVDRAQDLPPSLVSILEKLLKPHGSMFLCEDPAHGLYSGYSWREKGVSVMGRTRCLCTLQSRQIARAAWSLIEETPLAMNQLCAEKGPDPGSAPAPEFFRHGPRPLAVQIPKALGQRQWISDEIGRLVREEGVLPCEIAILHQEKYVLERYRGCVPDGVHIRSVNQQARTLYRVVFLPEMEAMLDRNTRLSLEEDVVRMRMQIHAAACRAQIMLYMLHKGRWPTILLPMLQHVDQQEAEHPSCFDNTACAVLETAEAAACFFQ